MNDGLTLIDDLHECRRWSAFLPIPAIPFKRGLIQLKTAIPNGIFVPMKPYSALAVTFLMVACSSPDVRQHTALMETIENKLRLPQEAGKVEKFGRAYKFGSPNRVEAFYFVPNVRHDDRFCEGAKGGGRTNGQIVLACPPPVGMKAGERRWFDTDVHLPAVNDGGCNYVDVVYDIRSRKVVSAKCHGVG